MATYKEISASDIQTQRSYLNQIVDVTQEDVSGSVSRRKYQHFVTGGLGPGVTSSLYQTVYDQNFTFQTSNAIFDVSFGLNRNSAVYSGSKIGQDSAGKDLFPSQSLMMREKGYVYQQFAGTLLGDVNATFTAPFDSSTPSDQIDVAVFLCFKRLFARDQVKRETFALKMFQTGSTAGSPGPNLFITASAGSAIYTDVGASNSKLTTYGGGVGNIVNAANPSQSVGLFFYDRGIAVLNMARVLNGNQTASGTIEAVNLAGTSSLGAGAKFIPDLVVSASCDTIIDHFCSTRLGSANATAITFQNVTTVNSSIISCRAEAGEFNYSSNPTYTDASNRIVVIDPGQEDTQQAFSFVTKVGLFDDNDNLLAVGSFSRPIEKSPEKDLSIRARLDY
jgi:hypothetical protein